jgi:hypothetical protein
VGLDQEHIPTVLPIFAEPLLFDAPFSDESKEHVERLLAKVQSGKSKRRGSENLERRTSDCTTNFG